MTCQLQLIQFDEKVTQPIVLAILQIVALIPNQIQSVQLTEVFCINMDKVM